MTAPIDLEALREHTPGPWTWWTSCSFRRLSAQGDGDVLCAVTQSDGHPDVHLKNGGWEGPDGRLIEIAPTLLAEYERLLAELTTRRARDAEVAELVAAQRSSIDEIERLRDAMFRVYATAANGGNVTPWIEKMRDEMDKPWSVDRSRDAILPFQRSDDKGDAT